MNDRPLKFRNIYILTLFCVTGLSFSTDSDAQPYIPTSKTNQVITHAYFTLSYDERHEQAEWVYYFLTPDRVRGTVPRSDKFREDEAIHNESARLSDYKGSGYDRGHLCPAADNKHAKVAMDESFLMSNMSPQEPSFNRGAWKRLEEQFREWAIQHEGLHVVTAGVLTDTLHTIGANRVSIPEYFYKIAYSAADTAMVGVLMANKKLTGSLTEYIVPVDSIEALTGIDFFPQLEDTLENKLEKEISLKKWIFTFWE